MKGSKKSESQWINTVLKSGTLNDKFSAYVILLQENPVHNLPVLETLIDFVSLKSRSHVSDNLLEKHPVMKWVVVGEVERLLYR